MRAGRVCADTFGRADVLSVAGKLRMSAEHRKEHHKEGHLGLRSCMDVEE